MAENKALVEQTILHNTSGNHNKYYEVSTYLMPGKKDKYTVIARWGRIENFKTGDPQWQCKIEGVCLSDASDKHSTLVAGKKQKGYKLRGMSCNKVAFAHQNAIDQGATTNFERTEHVEVTINWWDIKDEGIEERVV